MGLLDDFCRLCANKLDRTVSKDVFAEEHNHLLATIMECIQTDISNNDHYPKLVCSMCVWKLNVLAEMRERWSSTVKVFNEMLATAVQSDPDKDENWIVKVKEESFELEIYEEPEYKLDVDNKSYFDCGLCDRSFDTKRKLVKHVTAHLGIKGTSSPSDNSELPHTSSFGKRSKSGVLLFDCKDCGKSFSKRHLIAHRRTHTGEKPFKCENCSKSFTEKKNLVRHKRIHTGEKPFQCNDCDKSFADRTDFLRHGQMHSEERQFQCRFCNQRFSKKSRCNIHERIHDEDRRFQCAECNKGFSTKQRFLAHIRIHTGERPYKCEDCGKGFIEASNLRRHKLIHTRVEERRFHCIDCSRQFSDRSCFARHCLLHIKKGKLRSE